MLLIFIQSSTMDWYLEVKIWAQNQTVKILDIDARNTYHKGPEHLDFSVPRRARCVHSAWQKHQDAAFWVDINLSIKEGLTFDQTRSNAIILQETLPAYCIPKVVRLKTWEVLYENHTNLLDHHQRSQWDTITIRPEGLINWVFKFNNNQSGNSFNCLWRSTTC